MRWYRERANPPVATASGGLAMKAGVRVPGSEIRSDELLIDIEPETVLAAQRQCARRVIRGLLSKDDLRLVLEILGILPR